MQRYYTGQLCIDNSEIFQFRHDCWQRMTTRPQCIYLSTARYSPCRIYNSTYLFQVHVYTIYMLHLTFFSPSTHIHDTRVKQQVCQRSRILNATQVLAILDMMTFLLQKLRNRVFCTRRQWQPPQTITTHASQSATER